MPAVIYGDTAIVDTNGAFLHLRRHRPPEQLSWRSFKQGMLVCHQAFYVRTDIAQQNDYDLHYRHSADVDWCIRVMKQAEEMDCPRQHPCCPCRLHGRRKYHPASSGFIERALSGDVSPLWLCANLLPPYLVYDS